MGQTRGHGVARIKENRREAQRGERGDRCTILKGKERELHGKLYRHLLRPSFLLTSRSPCIQVTAGKPRESYNQVSCKSTRMFKVSKTERMEENEMPCSHGLSVCSWPALPCLLKHSITAACVTTLSPPQCLRSTLPGETLASLLQAGLGGPSHCLLRLSHILSLLPLSLLCLLLTTVILGSYFCF